MRIASSATNSGRASEELFVEDAVFEVVIRVEQQLEGDVGRFLDID